MKIIITELAGLTPGEEHNDTLLACLTERLPELEQDLVQDLSHISHFAHYAGGMVLDAVIYQNDNLYRLDYHYPWEINWSCADQMAQGVMNDKVRFTLTEDGEVHFKWLTLA
ncbi:MAG: hypothetical protein ACP5D0_08100 [Hydrogenovibrio sp.]